MTVKIAEHSGALSQLMPSRERRYGASAVWHGGRLVVESQLGMWKEYACLP